MGKEMPMLTGAAALCFLMLQETPQPAPSTTALVPLYWVVGLVLTAILVIGGILISIRMARISEVRKELMDDNARRAKELAEMFRHEFGPVKDAVEKFPSKVDALIAAHRDSCDGPSPKTMIARP